MTGRRTDPIAEWGDISARAGQATGYRADPRVGVRPRAGWSIGALAVAVVVVIAGLSLRPSSVTAPTGSGAHDSSTGPVAARADDGMFRLELVTPHGTYGPNDAIEPVATVTYLGPDVTRRIDEIPGRVIFRIEEIGGDRMMNSAVGPACHKGIVTRDVPTVIPFRKSGTFDTGFDRAWFDDPVLHLPPGTWRIEASLVVSLGDENSICDGEPHDLVVTNDITVSGGSGPSPNATFGSISDGVFRLRLTTPRGTYGPADAIAPIATVTYLGPNGETAMFHGSSPVGFTIDEVGGPRQMDGGMDLPCQHTVAAKDVPLTYRFAKAGTTEHGFDAAWYRDPVLHLPAGTWRIRAYLDVDVTDGTATCGGVHHHLEVENVVTVR